MLKFITMYFFSEHKYVVRFQVLITLFSICMCVFFKKSGNPYLLFYAHFQRPLRRINEQVEERAHGSGI